VAKILVADDNSNIQKMVGLALKDQGIDVVAVGNGEAAVRKISELKPDLVLADVFMPVRSGYEVCRYVKDDPALAHIPVILLVGAFDPLDEQEAQRVGADGVLKKPFVPPDPLISMVKSALMRAGVPLGNAPVAEKPAAAPRRSTAELLNATIGSRLAELSAERLPKAVPKPLEELPPPQVSTAAGEAPLAFGSLLNTPEEEEQVTAKPMIHLAAERNWDEEANEVEEEKEEAEESPGGGWHPGGLDEDLERAAAPSTSAPDWRDEGFHAATPGKSFSSAHWTPSHERPAITEAADSQSVAVTTVAAKPVDGPIPFTGDAWAAAMAAGVEEKLAEIADVAAVVPEAESLIAAKDESEHQLPGAASFLGGPAVEAVPAAEEAKSAEPANWAAVPETAWEMEAKKASLLASTWDAPSPASINETQDIPVYAVEQATALFEAPVQVSAYTAEPQTADESAGQFAVQESESPAEPVAEESEPKSWENAWEAQAAAPAPGATAAEEAHAEASPVEEHAAAPAAELGQAAMDELVAKVLGKMNPEVLQKVTREILRPVIEAIVRDEINSKKS